MPFANDSLIASAFQVSLDHQWSNQSQSPPGQLPIFVQVVQAMPPGPSRIPLEFLVFFVKLQELALQHHLALLDLQLLFLDFHRLQLQVQASSLLCLFAHRCT